MKPYAPIALICLVAACSGEPPAAEPGPEADSLDRAVQVTADQAVEIAGILTQAGQKCDAVETLAPQPPVWRIVCANKSAPRTAYSYDPAKKLLLADTVSAAEALRPTLAVPD